MRKETDVFEKNTVLYMRLLSRIIGLAVRGRLARVIPSLSFAFRILTLKVNVEAPGWGALPTPPTGPPFPRAPPPSLPANFMKDKCAKANIARATFARAKSAEAIASGLVEVN